jgi:imidazole glycerol phosphate synthase subunit HisF
MRIGAMLLTDGLHAYQSFGDERRALRYMGTLQTCLRALVYQGFDEISIALPAYFRSMKGSFAFEQLRKSIQGSYVSLPITLAGGTTEELNSLIVNQQCIERVSVNSMLFQDCALERLKRLQGHFGEQFIVANLVIKLSNGIWKFFDHSNHKFYNIDKFDYELLGQFDEVSCHFIGQHGSTQKFEFWNVISEKIQADKVILAGGVNDKKVISEAKKFNFAAVLMDNYALYSEHPHAM